MHKYTYGKNKFFTKRKIKKTIGAISILFGFVTLLYFFFPLISYHIYLSSAFAQNEIQAPLPQRMVLSTDNSIKGLLTSGITNVTSNYKDARSWFPLSDSVKKSKKKDKNSKIEQYTLAIPSQGIDNAIVSSIDFDLSKHLVQYFSTSESPIQKGTSVIFGHSTLPQWFDPKKYTSIFAKLHLIKNGDEIVLTINKKAYQYKIFSISIMSSDDPNIFSQSFDNSYITIVTCTPPGTTWKRLVVRASLQG